MKDFAPEGIKMLMDEPKVYHYSPSFLADAVGKETILEAVVLMCDAAHNMIVSLGSMRGIIPREEGAVGITEGTTRDIAILSRVGKPVCFTVTAFTTDEYGEPCAMLSRRAAQEKYRRYFDETVVPGDIFPAKVTHLEPFGAFCDIGCGIVALLPIDAISVSRISHPSDRFRVGDEIMVVLKQVAPDGKITVTHKELLGTWEQNAALFSGRQTVSGIIRSVEEYGVFVELTPNLAGLAEPYEGARIGQTAGVYIKSIIPEKMKIKLIIIDSFSANYTPKSKYFYEGNHIDRFDYSPPESEKQIFSVFQ